MKEKSWAFVGSNGSGKTALANTLCQEGFYYRVSLLIGFTRPINLSFEKITKNDRGRVAA